MRVAVPATTAAAVRPPRAAGGRSGVRRAAGPARSPLLLVVRGIPRRPLAARHQLVGVVLRLLLETVGARGDGPRPLLDLRGVDEVEQPARVATGADEQLAAGQLAQRLGARGVAAGRRVDSSRSASARCSSALRRSASTGSGFGT